MGLIRDSTEVVLTTDHPIHCKHLHRNAKVIMNNFVLAKPGARLIGAFLQEMANAVDCGYGGNIHDPCGTTGPGALTAIIEELGGISALEGVLVPHTWINPLPDMMTRLPDAMLYQSTLQSPLWSRMFDPFLAHFWWHSYIDNRNMLEIYRDVLFPPNS